MTPPSPASPPGSPSRLLRRLAILAVALVAALAAAEVGLRLVGDRERSFEQSLTRLHRRWVALLDAEIYEAVDDPVRRYAMRPGASTTVDGWLFRVNSHGARGPEFPLEKPAGEKRLLCLGDSFCFGLWCDEDETLGGHLVRLANEALEAAGDPTRWRAVNLGVPGYHSGQQLRALEQDGLALDPDLVLLYFNTNDINAEGFFLDEELHALRSDHTPIPVAWRRALWSSHLYGWIVRQVERSYLSRPSPHLDPDVPWAHVREDNQRATRDAIARMAELCAERDVPFFFVDQPLMTWSADAWRADWDVLPLYEWAEDLRADLGIPGVGLLGWMRGNSDGVDRGPSEPGDPRDFVLEPFFADEQVQGWVRALESGEDPGEVEMPAEPDFHLTGEGYGSMARVVYAALERAGLLP